MTVTLTSPAEGKKVGETYTGPREAWLLAEGYATKKSYSGPGVSNTGPATFTKPSQDPRPAENRESVEDTEVLRGSDQPFLRDAKDELVKPHEGKQYDNPEAGAPVEPEVVEERDAVAQAPAPQGEEVKA